MLLTVTAEEIELGSSLVLRHIVTVACSYSLVMILEVYWPTLKIA